MVHLCCWAAVVVLYPNTPPAVSKTADDVSAGCVFTPVWVQIMPKPCQLLDEKLSQMQRETFCIYQLPRWIL